MRRRWTIAVLGLATLFAACGDDEPEATADDADTAVTFSTLDASGDSYLDADEIAEWVDDEGIFTRWDADADSELDRDEIVGNAFELWDANGDGHLTQAEWKSGSDLWYPNELELSTFGDWDGDGDSELDVDEVREKFDLSALGEAWTADAYNAETFKKLYFELYDIDGDGKVTEDEWTAGSVQFGAAE